MSLGPGYGLRVPGRRPFCKAVGTGNDLNPALPVPPEPRGFPPKLRSRGFRSSRAPSNAGAGMRGSRARRQPRKAGLRGSLPGGEAAPLLLRCARCRSDQGHTVRRASVCPGLLKQQRGRLCRWIQGTPRAGLPGRGVLCQAARSSTRRPGSRPGGACRPGSSPGRPRPCGCSRSCGTSRWSRNPS